MGRGITQIFNVQLCAVKIREHSQPKLFIKMTVRMGADKSLAFPITPTGNLQHNLKNFSWMG
jgi:hypothetical protein